MAVFHVNFMAETLGRTVSICVILPTDKMYFGAMRNGLKYHDTFGAIAALSGAFITDESLLVKAEKPGFISESEEYKHSCFGPDLEAALESDRNPRFLIEQMADAGVEFPAIYMACGTEDSLLAKNQAIADCLKSHGVSFTFETGPGAHEWDFRDRRSR